MGAGIYSVNSPGKHQEIFKDYQPAWTKYPVASSKAKQPTDTDQHAKDIQCDQCKESDLVIPAAGFCESFTDYLCSSCLNLHKKLRTSKDHSVLYGDAMPSHRPTAVNEEMCSKHSGRKVEMVCCDDETLGCALCFFEGHNRCLNKSLISTLSEHMESSDELTKIQTASKKHTLLSSQLMQLIQKCRSTNEQCHAKSLENFQSFRVEIEALLDKLEDEVTNDAERVKGDNKEKLDRLTDMILSYKQQVDTCMENIDSCLALTLKKNDQLFIAVKKNKGQILDSVQKLEKLSKEIQIQEFGFLKEPSVKHMLKKFCKIFLKDVPCSASADQSKTTESNVPVKMEPLPSTVCTSVAKIPIMSPDDEFYSIICDLVAVSDRLLILTDNCNECLKMVDIVNNQIITRRLLTSPPVAITRLPGSRVAVSLPDIQQIQIFSSDVVMNSRGSIDVNGECGGIRCTGKTLIVSFCSPAKIQILDLNGQVLHTIQHDPTGQEMFLKPWYITLSLDNTLIYVGDNEKNTLSCIDMTGVLKWVYQDQLVKFPEGVVTGEGDCIYLYSPNTNSIHVISADGVKLAILSETQSGVHSPLAVCYSSKNQILVVSSVNSGTNPEDANFISLLSLR